jgi:hypothetical protein
LAGVDVVLADDLARDAGYDGRLAPPALLVGGLKPVPTPRYVGVLGLRGVGDEEGLMSAAFGAWYAFGALGVVAYPF